MTTVFPRLLIEDHRWPRKRQAGSGGFRSHSHFERMEEERQRTAQAKAEANKPKKVTLPRLKFLARNSFSQRPGSHDWSSVLQMRLSIQPPLPRLADPLSKPASKHPYAEAAVSLTLKVRTGL